MSPFILQEQGFPRDVTGWFTFDSLHRTADQELSCKLQTGERKVKPQILCFLAPGSMWGHTLEWVEKFPCATLALGVWIEKHSFPPVSGPSLFAEGAGTCLPPAGRRLLIFKHLSAKHCLVLHPKPLPACLQAELKPQKEDKAPPALTFLQTFQKRKLSFSKVFLFSPGLKSHHG